MSPLRLLSEQHLTEFVEGHPDRWHRGCGETGDCPVLQLVALARWAGKAHAALRRLPNVCACPEDNIGLPSCCYCVARALIREIAPAPEEKPHES